MNELFISISSACTGAFAAFLFSVFREYYAELCHRKSELSAFVYTIYPLGKSVWQCVRVTLTAHQNHDFVTHISRNSLHKSATARLTQLSLEEFDLRFICLDGNAALYNNLRYVMANLRELSELCQLYNDEPTIYNRHQFCISGYISVCGLMRLADVFNSYYARTYGVPILPSTEHLLTLRNQMEKRVVTLIQEGLDTLAAIPLQQIPQEIQDARETTLAKGYAFLTLPLEDSPPQGIFGNLYQVSPQILSEFLQAVINLDRINKQIASALPERTTFINAYAIWEACAILKMHLEVCINWGRQDHNLYQICLAMQKAPAWKVWFRKHLVRQSSFFADAHDDTPDLEDVY